MIGSDSAMLYRRWMDVMNSPSSENSRSSYLSYLNTCDEIFLNVTSEDGNLLDSEQLNELRVEIEQVRVHVRGDAHASLGKFLSFLDWLIANRDRCGSCADALDAMEGGAGAVHDNADRHEQESMRQAARESYSRFFHEFRIDENRMINFGIGECIFASREGAMRRWEMLRDALINDRSIFIRDDAHGFYSRLYAEIFGNHHIMIDPDGNTEPIAALSAATGYTTRPASHQECVPLHNYILSHVFDKRSMNPLLFSSVCNFAYCPVIFDPFTGNARGEFAERFKRAFRCLAADQFAPVYWAYKDFVLEHDVMRRIGDFNIEGVGPRAMSNFRRMASQNWDPNFFVP